MKSMSSDAVEAETSLRFHEEAEASPAVTQDDDDDDDDDDDGDTSSLRSNNGFENVTPQNNRSLSSQDSAAAPDGWSTEQDAAPLERLIGHDIMSPIAYRRDSYECWSAEKRMVLTQEVENLESLDSIFTAPSTTSAENLSSSMKSPSAECRATISDDCVNKEPYADHTILPLPSVSVAKGELSEGEPISKSEPPIAGLLQRSASKALNDSTGSAYSVDINSAKKKVGASSNAFLEHLRGAANRRKNQVISARDSLVAKQKELIETTNAKVAEIESSWEGPRTPVAGQEANPFKAFKARPMPPGSGGGLVGVPKVDKKPATTPSSPLLGARRQQRVVVKSLSTPIARLQAVKRSTTQAKKKKKLIPPQLIPAAVLTEPQFKARPLPSRFSTSGCQAGIPKVSKRPTTVPLSPLLGVRRTPSLRGSVSNSETSISLVGLNLLSPATNTTKIAASLDVENLTASQKNRNPIMRTPANQKITRATYVPHSTIRAKERAVYDEQRSVNEAKRLEETKRGWSREIRKKRAEIAKLREHL